MASREKEEETRHQRQPCACMENQKNTSFEEDVVKHDVDCSSGDRLSAEETEECSAGDSEDGLPPEQTPKKLLSITIKQDHFDLMRAKNKLLQARFFEVGKDKKRAEKAGAALPSHQRNSSIIRCPQEDTCQPTQNKKGEQPSKGGEKRRVYFSPGTGLKSAQRFALNLRVHLSEGMDRTVYMITS